MATFSKPTVVPNWATTSANIAVPSAGKRNDGWLSTEIPASDIENWNKRTQGEWLEWIDERFADGATDDELVILSPATTAEMLKLSNAIAKWSSAAGIEWESVAGIFTAGRSVTDGINLKGIGATKDIEFDGTLNRMSYNVTTDLWSIFNNSATASLTVDQTTITAKKAVTAELGVTASVNQNVVVSGTGQFKHGSRTKVFPASGGRQDLGETNQWTYDATSGSMDAAGASGNLSVPIHLDAGKRILSMTFRIFGGDTSVKTGFLHRENAFGVKTAQASATDASSGSTTIVISSINYTVLSNESLWATLGAKHVNDRWQFVAVEYDEP